MKQRTRARGVALQVLYEVDQSNHLPGNILKQRLQDEELNEDLQEFAYQIIFGVLPHTKAIDQIIAEYAPEWPFEQIAPIDRNILRIAFWEFGIDQKTPIKVAINEAVELAKVYGSDNAPGFINGVLGNLAKHKKIILKALQKAEFSQ